MGERKKKCKQTHPIWEGFFSDSLYLSSERVAWILSENFLTEVKAKLATLSPQDVSHCRVATVEHSNLAPVLLLEVREHLVPVWPPCLRPRLQSCHQISILLQKFTPSYFEIDWKI